MDVKQINCYLVKGLKIMSNERDSVRVALEAILLLLYAWNSCPVPGMDISCSLVAVAFPIDFSVGKHWELTSSPSTVVSYSKELATRLQACRLVADLLVHDAFNLSPYPTKLIPFESVNGADTRYGQIYKPLTAHPFKEAGIKGFSPYSPPRLPQISSKRLNVPLFIGPVSLSELNNVIAPFP